MLGTSEWREPDRTLPPRAQEPLLPGPWFSQALTCSHGSQVAAEACSRPRSPHAAGAGEHTQAARVRQPEYILGSGSLEPRTRKLQAVFEHSSARSRVQASGLVLVRGSASRRPSLAWIHPNLQTVSNRSKRGHPGSRRKWLQDFLAEAELDPEKPLVGHMALALALFPTINLANVQNRSEGLAVNLVPNARFSLFAERQQQTHCRAAPHIRHQPRYLESALRWAETRLGAGRSLQTPKPTQNLSLSTVCPPRNDIVQSDLFGGPGGGVSQEEAKAHLDDLLVHQGCKQESWSQKRGLTARLVTPLAAEVGLGELEILSASARRHLGLSDAPSRRLRWQLQQHWRPRA